VRAIEQSRRKEVRMITENDRPGLEQEGKSFPESALARRRFRITIDVEAALAAELRGGAALHTPENAAHTRALVEQLLRRPELVDRLLRCRALAAAGRTGRALEVEQGWGETPEQELLGPIFAELEPEARAYFTEELEDGASVYYFDGYEATVERVSVVELGQG
jgi:hypothetical protein